MKLDSPTFPSPSMTWVMAAITVLLLTLLLVDSAAAQVGSAGGAGPSVVADVAKPAAPAPRLAQADIESLADVVEVSNTAARELTTARLYLEAAERKSESVVYYSAAKRLRILAKMKLDPDVWDISLVTVGADGRQRQEWQLVPIKPTKPPSKEGGTP